MRIVVTDFPADDSAPHVRPAPIGHPIKISQVLKQPVPPGRVARLIIDGEGDTEGYLSCPAETTDSFVEQHMALLNGVAEQRKLELMDAGGGDLCLVIYVTLM
ncbi:uncharacterized protein PHACADRAFT_203242 [Phanerochaete carnosa HHB-10118-sp]|uniref:Uncharacterized protein n=1 Tax=Phanerochaete carnosa (strain HHB-10118-sp) TaxID=650164 RepID=K5VN34_PHACS|nr:uncharacterized protein PHACADRAFT_203242 [Phanerochaete carnosa HHB-10118-sp]EKM48110.1 hypothetical protein PHACADRAFT_203242 [Phanerochaete carnosa HHB-10118-sp]